MIEIKLNRDHRLPVRLTNNFGDPLNGVVYTDVTASLMYADTSVYNMGLIPSGNWQQIQSGAFAGQGFYMLLVTASFFNQTGSFAYAVNGAQPPSSTHIGYMKIVDVYEVDTYRLLGVPITSQSFGADNAQISASLVNVSASLWTMQASVSQSLGAAINRIRKVEEGRWKIDPIASTMTFYDPVDNVTPILVFALSGSNGLLDTTNPFERNRIG